MSDSFRPHGRWLTRLLCSWNFQGKNTGVGYHFLLQGIFPTQGSNPCLLCLQEDSLPLSQVGSPDRHHSLINVLFFLHLLFHNNNNKNSTMHQTHRHVKTDMIATETGRKFLDHASLLICINSIFFYLPV